MNLTYLDDKLKRIEHQDVKPELMEHRWNLEDLQAVSNRERLVAFHSCERKTKMYCSSCGTQIAPGLSYCNRCGASLKERSGSAQTGNIAAYLTAVTTIGIVGLGIMFGGTLVLAKKALLDEGLIGIFMLFTFLLVGTIEVMLLRQLSKLVGSRDEQRAISAPLHPVHELRQANPSLAEPLPSVTENTTRTLEYSRREQ